MRLVDRSNLVDIKMRTWDGTNYSPDWSIDFFDAGTLKYNMTLDAYEVDDVDYCIEQATDWGKGVGDFYNPDDIENRDVDVTTIPFRPVTADGDVVVKGIWLDDINGSAYEVVAVTDRIEMVEVDVDDDGTYVYGDHVFISYRDATNYC